MRRGDFFLASWWEFLRVALLPVSNAPTKTNQPMNTEQIIDDLYMVRDVIQLSPTPARLAAAAIMLRAAAKAIEDAAAAAASSDPAPGHPELPLEPMPVEADPDTAVS